MKFLSVLFAFALAAFVRTPALAAPLEAYGGLPTIQSVDISPDGSTLAMATSSGEAHGLTIMRIADGATQSYVVGSAKIRDLNWVGSQHVIITTSQAGQIIGLIAPKREYGLGFDLNIETRKLQPLLKRPPVQAQTGTHLHGKGAEINAALNTLAGPPEVRAVAGVQTLFLKGITFPDRLGVLTVFQIDLPSGSPHIVEIGDRYTRQILLGSDGAPVAKTTYDEDSGRWALKLRPEGGGWRENRVVEARNDPPFLVGLGTKPGAVVVAENGDTGIVVREVSPDGVWGEPLDVRDPDGPIFDPDTHRLIGLYALVGDERRYTFFDPQDQKVWNAVRAAFKGDPVRLASWSRDRKKIVVLVDSRIDGPGYALVDLTTRTANWLGAQYAKIGPEDLAKVEPIQFKAADGMQLTGYLTLPNGKTAKDLPLIVFPHGGPASRDGPGFDWWAQAMASRGYAVLQVNFRGSDGFGATFLRAGYGEWGRKMQTDLSDGVRYLAAQGTIDAKRVCIVGGSYGGYAALAGAALDTGVYRCAVSVAGISDLRRFVDWSRSQNGAEAYRYWTRFVGAEASRDPALTQVSPAAHVDRVAAPVLLIHGRDDTVVPLEQSRIMAEALERAGKPVELVVMKGEDHWLSRGETRLQTLTATMAFVEKHNPPN